jgi:hypothetical protein
MEASQQRERQFKFLSYRTVARYVLSVVSVLVVVQPSSEVLEGLINYPVYFRFEVLTAMYIKFHVSADVMPRGLVDMYHRVGRTSCLHPYGKRNYNQI